MKSLVWFAVFFVLSGGALAEDSNNTKIVKVTGVSEVRVVPDRAIIEIGVEKQSPNASSAKQLEDSAARRILSSLKANGIDEKDIQTTWLTLEPRPTTANKRSFHILSPHRHCQSRSEICQNSMAFWNRWCGPAGIASIRLFIRPAI